MATSITDIREIISRMSDREKEALINGVEMALDYNLPVSQADLCIYSELTKSA